MNIARIVVLTVALVACGLAAYLAGRSDNKPPPNKPVAQLQSVDEPEQSEALAHARQASTLSLVLYSRLPKGRTI